MSPAGAAALYGVVTFAALALAFTAGLHVAFGWPMLPSQSAAGRTHGTILLAFYVVAGLFARAVGEHGAKGATLSQAWRAGVGDLGRGIKGLFIR